MKRISTFAKRIKLYREQKELTLAELGVIADVPAQTLNRYELGQRVPKVDVAIEIAEKLNINPQWLQGYDVDEIPSLQDDTPPKSTVSLTTTGQRIGRAYDKATPPVQRTVEVALEPFMDNSTLEEEEDEIEDLQLYNQPVAAGSGVELLEGEYGYDIIRVLSNRYTRNIDFCLTITGNSMEPRFHDGDIILIKAQQDVDWGDIGIFILDGLGFVKRKMPDCLQSLNPDVADICPDNYNDIRCVGRVIGTLDPDWVV